MLLPFHIVQSYLDKILTAFREDILCLIYNNLSSNGNSYPGKTTEIIIMIIVSACKPVVFGFEDGPDAIKRWGRTGNAFIYQPTYGDNVANRKPGENANQVGTYWVGTYEKRPRKQTHPTRQICWGQ